MITKCKSCQSPIKIKPNRISPRGHTCTKCRKIITTFTSTCKCGKQFQTSNRSKAPTTCGNPNCSKSRKPTQATKNQIKESIIKSYGDRYIKPRVCEYCSQEYKPYKRNQKCCSTDCRRKLHTTTLHICKCGKPAYKRSFSCLECIQAYSSRGGLATIAKQITTSDKEDYLFLHFPKALRSHKKLLDGYEVDGYLEDYKLAIEYRGPWHYRNIMGEGTLNSTVNRDKYKERKLSELNVQLYPVGWALTHEHKTTDIDIEAYFIKAHLEEINPFKFYFDRSLFISLYNKLIRSSCTESNYCICQDTLEWYFKHLWTIRTTSHGINSIQAWENNKVEIINNRIRYSNLSNRSLRRYFKLFDYAPTIFPDTRSKYLASLINGNIIADPFMGYGGRLLGVTSTGKQYIGYDTDLRNINSATVMCNDLDIKNYKVYYGDSSQINKIEVDGIITSPPFFNKDQYPGIINNITEHLDLIYRVFSRFTVKDLCIIDYKPLNGCTIDDFLKVLPYKILKVDKVNFGGLKRSSIHFNIFCKS